jgi:hypothetical protein
MGKWLKWLGLFAFGFGVAVALGTGLVMWHFRPLWRLEERFGKWRLGSVELDSADLVNLSGQQDFGDNKVLRIKIPFHTAKINVTTGSGSRLKWDCQSPTAQDLKAELIGSTLTLNLNALNYARCALILPSGVASEFRGVNGHMEVDSIHAAMDISLTNGRVSLKADSDRVYDFDVNVKNGLQDFFPRSSMGEAIRVRVNVVNGLVNKD